MKEMLLAQRKEVAAELAQIDRALRAIEEPRIERPRLSTRRKKKRLSVGVQAIDTLKHFPNGLGVRELADEIEKRYSRTVKTSTLSWYLSKFKGAGKVTLDGDTWHLPA